MSTHSIRKQIEIHVKPEVVFDAWVKSEQRVAWWGEEGLYRISYLRGEVKEGETWSSGGVGKDGTEFVVTGTYLKVDRPHALSFTWKPSWSTEPETTVELEFIATEKGTLLKLLHSGFRTEEATADHNDGWNRVLGWMSAYVLREA